MTPLSLSVGTTLMTERREWFRQGDLCLYERTGRSSFTVLVTSDLCACDGDHGAHTHDGAHWHFVNVSRRQDWYVTSFALESEYARTLRVIAPGAPTD